MSDPIARVLKAFPKAFFQYLVENLNVAFVDAYRMTRQYCAEPERLNMLGQARHAFCEKAFREAAKDSDLQAIVLPTKPAGGCYSLVTHEDVHLIRGNVQKHCGLPRATRFRKERAQINAWLDRFQYDLLREVTEPSSDQLCAMIVVTAYPHHYDPSIPAFVGLGVPRSDMSEWVVLEPIQNLLARYHDFDPKSPTPSGTPVVEDRAVPVLKKTLDKGATG